MGKRVNVFKIVMPRDVDVAFVQDRLGEDFLSVEFVEEIELAIGKEPLYRLEIELPAEYKRLLIDNEYYRKYHLINGTLREYKSENFILDGEEYFVCVNFRFGNIEYGGFLEIELLAVMEEENHSFQCDMEWFKEYKDVYDVMLSLFSKPEYVRVIVK